MNPIESIMEASGLHLIGTGGGCTAFCLENPRLGAYILVTDEAQAPERMDQLCEVGFYPSQDHTEAAFSIQLTPAQLLALNIKVEP